MLTQRIFDWARRTPDKPALIRGDQALSYLAFADTIARARGGFVRRGLFGPGIVSVAVEDQAEVWISTLALRSLGVTTMTRGFDAADALLLRCVVKSAGEEIQGLEAACAAAGTPITALSFEEEPPLGLDEGPRIERPGGQIVHTSGTTGAHKMVLIDPAFEEASLAHRAQVLGIGCDSVGSAFTCPVWTGLGYKLPAAAWFAGGAVVMDWTTHHAPLLEPSLTHAVMTPLILRAILATPSGAFPRNEAQRLIIGGGTARWSEIEAAKQRVTPNIFSHLVATETHSFGWTPIETPEDLRWHRLAPGVEVQVVGEDDRPVPVGQVGRVRISTADGPTSYLNDEAATARFFRGGYFYPGDLGFFGPEGRLALQGRATDVLNIDGVKIAPGPIEHRLREAIGAEVVLLTLQGDSGEELLHVVVESSVPPQIETVSEILRAEFDRPMRAQVLYVASLPRNAMGKVMRPRLTAEIVAARAKGGAA